MDDDIYTALIGAAPTDGQSQKAIAAQLRRRRSFGELGALTGDRVLQPFGQSLMKSADADAASIQDTRLKDVDNAQTEKYQTGQLGHMGSVLAETIRAQNMDDATTRRGQDLSYEAALARAAAAGRKSGGKPPRLTISDKKDLQDLAQDIGSMEGLESFIKRGGSFGAKKIAGVPIPGSRALANTKARFGFGDQADKESFLAKQEFDRLYTLGARNRLFGATLTNNEQKAWDDANPQIRQSDEQIAQALPILRKVMEHRIKHKSAGLAAEGYNQEAINEYAEIPQLNLLVGGETGEDDDIDALSPEEAAELELLRKKHKNGR